MIRLIFLLALSTAAAYGLVDDKDCHWEHETREGYDVHGLNDLVARLSLTKQQKQADALADLWHITDADLSSETNIFGEKR